MILGCKYCNNNEFVTIQNHYEIYKVVNGKLEYQKSETIDEKFKLYCRECSEEFKLSESDIQITQ